MIAAAQDFYARGWMLGTSGNVSVVTAATPLGFHISASGRDKGQLTPDDFIDVDATGTPRQADAPQPSAETLVHAALYERTQAGAIYHVHQVFAALCSSRDAAAGEVVLHDLEMLKGLGLWDPSAVARIPIVPNHAHIPDLARAVADAARDEIPGVLVCRHGLYAWGKTPAQARRHIEVFDYLFQYSFHASMAGL